jgi:hypothetical protein
MIIKDCEIWHCKLDPKRPNDRFDKDNPTWECQIRTSDKTKKKQWEDANLLVKPVIPDDDTPPYWKVNLRRRKFKADGSESPYVELMDGQRNPVDPHSIGNGSIANVKVFQYDKKDKSGVVTMLTGVQITKHIVYIPKPRDDDFEDEEYERISPPLEEMEDSDVPF